MDELSSKGEKRYKIASIGSEPLITGLRLAGVKEARIAKSGEEAEKAIEDFMERDDIGMIIIGEGVSNMIRSRRIKHIIDTSLMPLIVEIPDYGEKEEESDALRRLILRAVGIDITKTKIKKE